MNIHYEIKEDTFYGKGIYVLEDIKVGTCIWTYKLNDNVFEYNETESISYIQNLPTLELQQRFLELTFGKGNILSLITDDGRYINHSDEPNCKTDLVSGNCYAIKNIKKGNQILENYNSFTHPPFLLELLKKYKCEPTYYTIDINYVNN
jgi:hypothetical protein